MTTPLASKYRPFPPIALPDRTWPARTIARPPRWCSVDLRDGNQALPEPMEPVRKRVLFDLLVRIGFKEIEVGFPSASQPDFDFVRQLIEDDLVPPDVTIQVITQAREPLIRRTFDALRGARRAIVHLYNSTSPVQRRVVFGLDRAGVRELAVGATKIVAALARAQRDEAGTEIVFQYSPESFTATELDFARDVCDEVVDAWAPAPERPAILNLPATVEVATPNVYADQIEWMGRHLRNRARVTLSVHPHNDRGSAVAAAELALLAGAERVEGTLFGNGERTGNVDLVTVALNLLTQGMDPALDLTAMDEIVRTAERCTRLPIHPRHPYAGGLVYTAFSGSHQDAIRKGLAARARDPGGPWEVPYLPLDPADVGRRYDEVVRLNSQSGKGGVGHVMEAEHGFALPRGLLVDLAQRVQEEAETTRAEVTPSSLMWLFEKSYLDDADGLTLAEGPCELRRGQGRVLLAARIVDRGAVRLVSGEGETPAAALLAALGSGLTVRHREQGTNARALPPERLVSYVAVSSDEGDGALAWGVAQGPEAIRAELTAALRAAHRARRPAAPAGVAG